MQHLYDMQTEILFIVWLKIYGIKLSLKSIIKYKSIMSKKKLHYGRGEKSLQEHFDSVTSFQTL